MNLSVLDKLDVNLRSVLRTGAHVFVIKVAGTAFALGFSVAVARLLGVEGAGIFFLCLTMVTVSSALARFGLDNVVLRLTSIYYSQSFGAELRSVYATGVSFTALCSVVAAVAIWSCAPLIAVHVFDTADLIRPLRYFAFGVPALSLLLLHIEFLKGVEKIQASQIIQMVGLTGIALVGTLLLAPELGVIGVVVSYSIALYLMIVAAVVTLRGSISEIGGRASDQRPYSVAAFSTLLGSALPLYVVEIATLINGHLPQLLLGAFHDPASVGLFAVAHRIAHTTSYILGTMNIVTAPRYAALYSKGQLPELKSLAQSVTKLIILVFLPIFLVFVVFPEVVLSLFGPEFKHAAGVLMILALGQFVNVAAGSVGYLLMMTGHGKSYRNSSLAAAFVSTTLCVLLIPTYGMYGAAIGYMSGVVAQNIISAYLVWRHLGFVPTPSLQVLRARTST